MALPPMRARPRRDISPATWSYRGRMFTTTTRVGRARAGEQQRDYRFTPTRLVPVLIQSSLAPNCTVVQRTASPERNRSS